MVQPGDSIQLRMPAGSSWLVGVSGGADSVALLLMLHDRSDLTLRVAHLNHELRGAESEADAEFVGRLCKMTNVPFYVARRSEIEPTLANPPANPSARYRAVRLAFFEKIVEEQKLDGVVLAHHADDQAETVFQRLVRGSLFWGLAAMSRTTNIGTLRIVRPLLNVRRAQLRSFLESRGQTWREDASNESDDYLRNRVRRLLDRNPNLGEALLRLASSCGDLRTWANGAAPILDEQFPVAELQLLPSILARQAARLWLLGAGVPPDELGTPILSRLIEMAADAATPSQQTFPGDVQVRRSGRTIRKV
jgi:tRNA(Ile)-lysidine synthetase-like protein